MVSAPPKTPQQQEDARRAEFVAARNVYIVIIASFLTVAVTAAVLTMKMESEKTGFRPIQTEAPISFFDKTYMKK